MSIKALIDLVNQMKLYNEGKLPPEEADIITQRLKQSREASAARLREFNLRCDQRLRDMEPSAELLRKCCTL